MSKIPLTALLAGAALVAGCTASQTEQDFGRSVREVVTAQAAIAPDKQVVQPAVVEGADPDMVNNAVNEMRTDLPKRSSTDQGVTINVGDRGRN